MSPCPTSLWTQQPLPGYLEAQLVNHGHIEPSAHQCAQRLIAASGPVARASLLVDLGACRFIEGDIDGALALWRQVISSGEPAATCRALMNLGLLHEHLHLYDQAIAALQSAVEQGLAPHSSHAQLVIARCQCSAGDHRAGMRTLAVLIEALMGTPSATALLGEALLALGDAAAGAGDATRADRAWRAAVSSGSERARSQAVARLAVPNRSAEHVRAADAPAVLDQRAAEPPQATHTPPMLDQRAAEPPQAADTPAVLDQRAAEPPQATHTPPMLDLSDIGAAQLDRIDDHMRFSRRSEARDLLAAIDGASLAAGERFRFVDALLRFGLVNRAIDELEVLLGSPVPGHTLRAAFTLGEIYRTHQMLPEAEAMYRRVVGAADTQWSTKAAAALAEVLEDFGDRSEAISLWQLAATTEDDSVRAQARSRLATLSSSSTQAPGAAESGFVNGSAPHTVQKDAQIPPEDPVVVVLSALGGAEPAEARPMQPIEADASADDTPVAYSPEAKPAAPMVVNLCTSDRDGTASTPDPLPSTVNPYAELAPDDAEDDDSIQPTSRDPYAELAPSYARLQSNAPDATKPDHLAPMPEDWPAEEPSGFFARFL